MQAKILLTTMTLIGGAAFAVAQTSHSGHGNGMDHSAHGQEQSMTGATLSEPGQGAFAALSEVVRVLEADSSTDWTKVDLTGLRAHLVDMDRLVMNAVVTETDLPDGISAIATGDMTTIATLQCMVPVVARTKGLGFFGLMASQDHHRAHHLMMARGEDAHGH